MHYRELNMNSQKEMRKLVHAQNTLTGMCMYVYVCMCVFCVCMYVCVHACMYV